MHMALELKNSNGLPHSVPWNGVKQKLKDEAGFVANFKGFSCYGLTVRYIFVPSPWKTSGARHGPL